MRNPDIFTADTRLDDFRNYKTLFAHHDRYGVKFPGRTWTTKKKVLTDTPIKAHLDGAYFVGTRSRWHPEYTILDIDDRPLETVDSIREFLGLTDNNSMVCKSESVDSWHVLIRP